MQEILWKIDSNLLMCLSNSERVLFGTYSSRKYKLLSSLKVHSNFTILGWADDIIRMSFSLCTLSTLSCLMMWILSRHFRAYYLRVFFFLTKYTLPYDPSPNLQIVSKLSLVILSDSGLDGGLLLFTSCCFSSLVAVTLPLGTELGIVPDANVS